MSSKREVVSSSPPYSPHTATEPGPDSHRSTDPEEWQFMVSWKRKRSTAPQPRNSLWDSWLKWIGLLLGVLGILVSYWLSL